jgi:exonuclease SbcC
MIKSLSLQNFQSHADSTLEFDPGVNVIVGSSDSGKTAILRALKWLIWNRPSGDSFRSTWGGETKVEIITGGEQDEAIITRTKDKDNLYLLGDERFEAFGSDVPEEIKKTLNLSEINLQQQLDSPFLLTESPGGVAKHFNQVANLDQIDQGLKFVQSKIQKLGNEISVKEDDIKALAEQAESYSYLDKMEEDIETVEFLQEHMIATVNQKKKIDEVVDKLEDIDAQLPEIATILVLEKPVDAILSDMKMVGSIQNELKNLDYHLKLMADLEIEISTFKDFLAIDDGVTSILSLYAEKTKIIASIDELDSLVSKLHSISNTIDTVKEDLKVKEDSYKENMPDTCPLCNQKII